MARRVDAITAYEDLLLQIAYGLEQFTIRQVSDQIAGIHLTKREAYKIAQELFKFKFEEGDLVKVQEARQHWPIVYAWKPE